MWLKSFRGPFKVGKFSKNFKLNLSRRRISPGSPGRIIFSLMLSQIKMLKNEVIDTKKDHRKIK